MAFEHRAANFMKIFLGFFALPNAHFAINKKAVRHESRLRLLALKQHGWNLQMEW